MRVDSCVVLSRAWVCAGEGGCEENILWSCGDCGDCNLRTLDRTHSSLLPDSSDWEKGGWSERISAQIVFVTAAESQESVVWLICAVVSILGGWLLID